MRKQEKAITLIALVITIIILLILAGISISALTNTGIFKKAIQAKEESEENKEIEAIQLAIYYKELNKYIDKDNQQIGEKLYDKNVENGSKWHVIVLNDLNKTYGTGYTYFAKDSNLEDIKLKYDWVVEESTQNIIKLEENSFTDLSYKSAIGVTEGLIFNLDPSVIENATKENINEKLGENVELVNFDWDESSGLTNKAFNFDGVNDYIKIKYDNDEEKNKLAQNGFTFEFYGTYDGGTSYNDKQESVITGYKGLFCYWNGNEKAQAGLRFGISGQKRIFWNAGFGKYKSDYSESENTLWNIKYDENPNIESNRDVYFTVFVDCIKNNYEQVLYANGNKICEGSLNNEYWNEFVEYYLKSLKYFCIGRSSITSNGSWHYSKMNAYFIKLYNRGLNEQEVKENYNKAVAYHKTL